MKHVKTVFVVLAILIVILIGISVGKLGLKVQSLESQIATLSAVTPEPVVVVQEPAAVSTPDLSKYTTEDRVGSMVATALGQLDYATNSDIEVLTNNLALLEDQVATTGGNVHWLRQELQMFEGQSTHIGALIGIIASILDLTAWSAPCDPGDGQLQLMTMYGGGSLVGNNYCFDAIEGGDSPYRLEPYTQGTAYVTLVRETAYIVETGMEFHSYTTPYVVFSDKYLGLQGNVVDTYLPQRLLVTDLFGMNAAEYSEEGVMDFSAYPDQEVVVIEEMLIWWAVSSAQAQQLLDAGIAEYK